MLSKPILEPWKSHRYAHSYVFTDAFKIVIDIEAYILIVTIWDTPEHTYLITPRTMYGLSTGWLKQF